MSAYDIFYLANYETAAREKKLAQMFFFPLAVGHSLTCFHQLPANHLIKACHTAGLSER